MQSNITARSGLSGSYQASVRVTSRNLSATALRTQVLQWLTHQVPEPRLQHILRVEQMAIALAEQHSLDVERAAQAAFMHDLAKCFKPQQLLEVAHQEGWDLDPVEVATPHLLHAEVGAVVARDHFGVDDPEVLEAIRNHTLGQPGMSALSCVVFLADTLEPGRGDTPELETLRQISHENLDRAVFLTCDYSLRHLLSGHKPIHPRAVLTRNWFLERSRRLSNKQELKF